ncbi:V-type ATP synthase subunit I [Maribacter sp. 2307ULW6-5]|uniref:V-type ATP synthase subunit I n=1 Tax=Maribacter sp. 2307ULW6-5 TaxID=3386275 RepID=UPI0039BC8B11
MIVRMKEIALFTTAQKVDATVQRLGELRVVDIKEVKTPAGRSLETRTEALQRATKALDMLRGTANGTKHPKHAPPAPPLDDPKQLVDRILKTSEVREALKQKIERTQENIQVYATWGADVQPQEVLQLKKKGLYLRLYETEGPPPIVPEGHRHLSLGEKNGVHRTVLIGRTPEERLRLKEVKLPKANHATLLEQLQRKERQWAQLDQYLADQVPHLETIADYESLCRDRLGTQRTLEGMGDVEGHVKYLRGYLPKTEVDAFKKVAAANNWGYAIEEPENLEDVPVYVKNPKWISIINPVMKFIDIVPGYKEVDVSIYFLIAFALFFAMLVGDAGYGALFLLITLLLWKKIPSQARLLICVLSIGTMVWGVLSGTYFGSEYLASQPWAQAMIIPNIASFGVDNIEFMMHLSFLIGAVHLTIAHLVKGLQFINTIKVLSEVGWIALVWSLFLVVEQLVLGKPMPSWSMWLFGSGALLVALFSAESTNFFKSMAISLGNLPLSLINGFSDIVSYVRLFAVGMATVAVATSFNGMIAPNGFGGMGLLELLMAAVGLLLGHGLNIALALMAVMVHGIRLNMLEFAGHLGVDFSGVAYNPFTLSASKGPDPGNKTTSN